MRSSRTGDIINMPIEMKERNGFDVIVIGGGIIGLASAYKIQMQWPDIRIAVLEKEDRLAAHQTGRNSGVIHSGLYYEPGSYKAENCAKGRRELIDFAAEHNIQYEICGKVIVATDQSQLDTLENVFKNALANQIEGVERITPEQIKGFEPTCGGIEGLYVPGTGIIDFKQVAGKLAELIESRSQASVIQTCCCLKSIETKAGVKKVATNRGNFTAKFLINCGGLYCDRIARADGVNPGIRIVPFRGDYYELTEKARQKVRNLIYPVADRKLPFLGVHFTRMIDGTVECGPNAVFSFKREGYGKLDFSLKDSLDSLTWPGTWIMFARHFRYGLDEYRRAFSKKQFLTQLQKLMPSLEAGDIKPSRAGVRAQALGPMGQLIENFKIETGENSIHVLNAPSPAATASLAIGQTISRKAAEYFGF